MGNKKKETITGATFWAKENKAFPELTYQNKLSEEDIFQNTPDIELEKTASFGDTDSQFQNMLIYGDNLSVMKFLLNVSKIRRRIDLIYIDPPFSTQQHYRKGKVRTSTISYSRNDLIAYSDNLQGWQYLEYIRQRLIFLQKLLSNKGTLYLHIDTKIGHYLKIIMDEVFGRDCFINDISRIKCNPKNFHRKGYGNIKDMVLFYSKTKNYIWNNATEDFSAPDIQRLFPKTDSKGQRYTTTPLHAPGETQDGPTGKPWRNLYPPQGRHWRYPPEELERLDQKGLIEWSSTGNPRKKIYATEKKEIGKKKQDIWEYKDPPNPDYPTQKNSKMLEMVINASSNKNSIVLDCFAGSGSTILAAEKLGRRWIAIDNSPYSIETVQKRLTDIGKSTSYIVYQTKKLESSKSNLKKINIVA